MHQNVLLVEDDPDLANLVALHLTELQLKVFHASSGEQALKLAVQHDIDLVILDVMLPGISGLDVCRELKTKQPELSVIMLTSRDSETDRVLGLELGADDYISKPYSVRELQARVRAQLRKLALFKTLKSTEQTEQSIRLGDLQINHLTHQVIYKDEVVELTATEYELLHHLAKHPDQVFSRSQLLSSVWGYHHSGYEHTVNSHINRLRAKLERNATKPEIVQTVWGVGYKFNRRGVCA
ncbi:response regulator transcription factor [Thalassotalea sp. LPB0316]|uniref:response regulator transcription factor n=1 Tax=Thalassotalea sp. LPB0316 TaxID=2769490 RepID=UPI0018689ADC|nr:response regulator transcription factor [Thalassotalea sp. LPB0316]QOL25253.1 response regulator transcription factor [Thalassotalea sp. LPB0316]